MASADGRPVPRGLIRLSIGRNLWMPVLAALCMVARAQDAPEEKNWRVLIEPAFMKPPVSFAIPKAERTLLVPGYVNGEGDVVYFTRGQWSALKIEWADFFDKARANAAGELAKLKPELVRDKRKVVEYAVLQSENPLTAGVVFAPGFLKQFEDVFGAKLVVVIPNRYTVFVFPKLAGTWQQYGPMVRDAYLAAPHRVSIEVFELSADGIRAAGIYSEP